VNGNDTSLVDNIENPTSNFSAITNSTGYIPQQILTEFMANGTYNSTSGYLYFNNYTISASKAGFNDNSIGINLTSSTYLNILLRALSTATTIFGKGQDSYELALDVDNGELYASVNSVNALGSIGSGWNHVAMTFDSGTIKLYVNGVQVGTAGTSSTPSANMKSVMLGNGSSLRLDELRFYSRPLTPSEIEQHYLFGSALKAILFASGAGSFGRNFNISAATSEGSFSNKYITSTDLLAGTTQSVNLPNVTGTPYSVSVISNSCSQRLEAMERQLQGVYC